MSESLVRAWDFARKFCRENPEWKTIDQIPGSELTGLHLTFEELPTWEKKLWRRSYKKDAKEAWEALGTKPLRVDYAFMGDNGVIYSNVTVMPMGLNHVMILKVGKNEPTPQ